MESGGSFAVQHNQLRCAPYFHQKSTLSMTCVDIDVASDLVAMFRRVNLSGIDV